MGKQSFGIIFFTILCLYLKAQTLEATIEKESCECFHTIEKKGQPDEILETFNSQCFVSIFQSYTSEIKAHLLDTLSESSPVPGYKQGYLFGLTLGITVMSNMINNCPGFYDHFEQIIPEEFPTVKQPVYGEGEIDSLTKYIEIGVNLYSNYCDRAMAYYEEGKIDEAIQDLKFAIETDQSKPIAFLYSGILKRNDKRYCEAYSDFKKVYELSGAPSLLIVLSVVKQECEKIDSSTEE